MAAGPEDIDRLIRAGLPGAEVTVADLRGDGKQYAATIISPLFRGYSRVEQHRMIHALLRDRIEDFENLTIHTAAPP